MTSQLPVRRCRTRKLPMIAGISLLKQLVHHKLILHTKVQQRYLPSVQQQVLELRTHNLIIRICIFWIYPEASGALQMVNEQPHLTVLLVATSAMV